MKQINQKIHLSTLILTSLFAVACGGGGGGDDGGDSGSSGGSGGGNGGGTANQTPIADAGTDLTVSRNFTVNLDASDSSDADDDTLTYTWTQTAGPDVTGGTGSLDGKTPAFVAPAEVDTIIFDLVVNDGIDDSEIDSVMINVLEDVNVAYFVDADDGSDTDGSGSSDNPFASIAKALCEVTADQQDIYVKNRSDGTAYDETSDPCPGTPARDSLEILSIPTGTSIYGGYADNWVRKHQTERSVVATLHHGFRFGSVDLNAWFSGFDVQAGDSPNPEDSVSAVYAVGGSAALEVSDNQLSAGDVGFGVTATPGSSYGLLVALMEGATIERNTISAGLGGDGLDVGNVFTTEAASGSAGSDATSTGGASGGDGKGSGDYDGGVGGNAGTGLGSNGSGGTDGQGSGGGNGGSGGSGNTSDNGSVGGGGDPGGVGSGGSRGSGSGVITAFEDGGFFAHYSTGNGGTGVRGGDGYGGGGGGGGEATIDGLNGGGGGGGGGGGQGGAGGAGAPGGGASIGIFIADINTSSINDNIIFSDIGGVGATGGQGQTGGDGGIYGTGAAGNCGIFGCGAQGGNGARGGSGGKGGTGGRGGAGGGGPSYGIAVGSNIAPTITGNDITSGDGGFGGFGGNAGNGGSGGHSYAVFDNDINDGMTPALINNTLTFGLPGDGGGTTGSGGSIGSAGISAVTNW